MWVSEFDNNKRLKADFLFVVGNILKKGKEVKYLIPREEIKPDNLRLLQTYNLRCFQYEIAEERETVAIPISEKVFGLMEKCNCSIINISADEEKKEANGTYRINENVLIEIGAAYLHYKRRVILLIDNRLRDRLPSNIKGLAAIFYEGDELSWSAGTKLQKALTEFRSTL